MLENRPVDIKLLVLYMTEYSSVWISHVFAQRSLGADTKRFCYPSEQSKTSAV